jgi:hypothetical protein
MRKRIKNLDAELSTTKRNLLQAQTGERSNSEKLERIRDVLKTSRVVTAYYYPVLLVGPRQVGKTSLLLQWHAPWRIPFVQAEKTYDVVSANVPLFDFRWPELVPHFADEEILVESDVHLYLKVHDFPGDIIWQDKVARELVIATSEIRKETEKPLGVGLICMFDASEAVNRISADTRSYYTGDLFRSLKQNVPMGTVVVDKVIIVLNKFDLLQELMPGQSDDALFDHCCLVFKDLFDPIKGICAPDRISVVFTVLDMERMKTRNRGSPVVRGEVARHFVESVAPSDVAQKFHGNARSNAVYHLRP